MTPVPAEIRDMGSFEGKAIQGRYLLDRLIGEGNFGAVFASTQRFLGVPTRRVAVKVSKHTGMTEETARDVFSDAFRLAEAMDQMTDFEARSHLVHVYDVGLLEEEQNRGYVVMEFVEGTTVAEQFRTFGRVPPNLILKWARQICLGLKGLHGQTPPVIHRDLKPDNVLLGTDRHVRLVDFGLAAKLQSHGFVPGTAGTTAYMAPETMKGRSIPASDVYSLGIMLFEGLTGEHPFRSLVPPFHLPGALHSEWLHEQKSRLPALPPSALNQSVDRPIDALVLRCLEFHPRGRFRDAGEVLRELDVLGLDKGPPGQKALEEGRILGEGGDQRGAARALEKGLSTVSARDARFSLLRELGRVLAAGGDAAGAARRLEEAWETARDSAVLRSTEERIALLEELVKAFLRSGNSWKSQRYAALKSELERKRDGGGL